MSFRSYRVALPSSFVLLLASAVVALVALPRPAAALSAPHAGSGAEMRSMPATNAQLADKHLNARVNALLAKMTLEEKIGQLVQYSAGTPTGPGTDRQDYKTMIAAGEVGSLLNVRSAKETNMYQKIAIEKSRLHIPLLFGLDVIHGYQTTFPVPLALASSFDPDLVQATAHMAATEASADGIRWTFSPMVDIARDARWGRIVEGAGESPYLGAAMARAYVHGYQGSSLSNPDSIAACVKHFAAYGAAIAGRDYNSVDMSDVMLRQVYLVPYQAAIDAGAATVMSSFNSLNGVPETANPYTLTQILRKEWGFNGFVVSDYGAVHELIAHGVALDNATAARKALTAGLDMDMEGNAYHTRLATLVRTGEVPESLVDDAVRRILRVKFALGLFDHPYVDENAPAYAVTPEKSALARKAAEESFVLLQNQAHQGQPKLLPISTRVHTLALIGPFGDSAGEMIGSWGGMGNAVTLRETLDKRMAATGGKVLYAKGTDILTQSDAGFQAAIDAAKQSDLVLITLGEDGASMTGEASSRAHLDLPGNQEKLLEAVVATGKPVVLIVFSGRPLVLDWAAQHVPAILEAWFPGMEAGPALTDVLFGNVNPSGKLPVSFPYAVGQEPLYLSQFPSGRPAGDADLSHPPQNAQEKYLSRYIDAPNAPLFPFGYGLSYTSFDYAPVTLSTQQLLMPQAEAGPDALQASTDVRNAGSVAGTEIVQLYIRIRGASMEEPVRQLEGFQRVTLAPGESKHVTFQLGFPELSFINAQSKRVVEPAQYTVYIGGSSQATQSAEFNIVQ
ncbi:MAG TPA: beta-glucosidase BglX [Acidobacteriaceae bacterium]|jgi:beta-glucosidase|nr:beta-glucosidase BglX [Acidobacteriaceae bacterium]